MKRKNGFIILSVIFLLLLCMITASANEGIKVYLDEELLEFDVPPMVQNERTLVPMRAIFEKLGATVEWNQETQTARATKDNLTIGIKIGSGEMTRIDSNADKTEIHNLDVPAVAVNGRTLIPLRAVSEAFLCKVEWNGLDKSIYIANTGIANEGQLLYSVGLLSDVHIDPTSADVKDANSQRDFANALQFFNSYGCVATFISGDITNSGDTTAFAKYVELRDKYKGNMNVFTTTGNHEASNGRTYKSDITNPQCIAYNIDELISNHYFYYIENGKYTYWNISPGNYTVDTASNITINDPSIVLPEGDVYIFLGVLGDVNNGLFWNESLQWIYETLEANKNKRCFVFEHVRPEKLEGYTNGSYTNDIYKSFVSGNANGKYLKPLWGNNTEASVYGLRAKTFEHLMSQYTNCIWFHGHTHMSADTSLFAGTPGYDIALVDSHFGDKYSAWTPANSVNNTKWTWSVHVPSVAEPRTPSGVDKAGSEGIIMDVYKDKVVLKYINFADTIDGEITYVNEFYSNEVYELDTTLDEIGIYTPTYANIGSEKVYLVNP